MSGTGMFKRQTLQSSVQQRPSHTVPAAPVAPVVSNAGARPAASLLVQEALAPTVPAVTQAELDRIKESARTEGLALGRKQAQQEAEKATDAQRAELETTIEAVNKAWREERERMVAALADFAFVCVNRMLGDCLHDPALAVSAVKAALRACEAWQEMTVELHPNDAGLIGDLLRSDAALADKSLRIVASPAVRVGGCRITSTEGSLDARLDFQLAQLRARLDAERFGGDVAA